MLNIEYYKDELKEIIIRNIGIDSITGKPKMCDELFCLDCVFKDQDACSPKKVEQWLQSEHVEQVDWSKVEVDTPILVRNTEKEEWQKRHFARFKNGKVYAWYDGLTSWSTAGEDDVNFWKYAKLAESEEYMNNSQIIEQLESIKQNALEFTRQKDASEVWSKDVEALDEAINVLSSNGWIPCSERLPEEETDYLCCYEYTIIGGTHEGEKFKDYGVFYYDGYKWIKYWETINKKNIQVVAWQPLPEPYEEEPEDE